MIVLEAEKPENMPEKDSEWFDTVKFMFDVAAESIGDAVNALQIRASS